MENVKEDAHSNDWNNDDHDEEKFGDDNGDKTKKNIVSWNGFHFVVQENPISEENINNNHNAETGCYYLLEEYYLIPRNVEEQYEKKINLFMKGCCGNNKNTKIMAMIKKKLEMVLFFVYDGTNNEVTEKIGNIQL